MYDDITTHHHEGIPMTTRTRRKPTAPPPAKDGLISEQVAFPLRLLPADKAALRQIAAEEERTITAVVMRALRDKYPERFTTA